MDRVRRFLFDHGLLGSGAASADGVGIELTGGRTLVDPKYVKLRLTALS